MRLQRLKQDHPNTEKVYQAASKLIKKGVWQVFPPPAQIVEINTLPLVTDMKFGNWGIALSIRGISELGEELIVKLFVKQTSQSLFDGEVAALNLLSGTDVQAFEGASLPIFVDHESNLIASELAAGENAKWMLRQALLRPWQPQLRSSVKQRLGRYGKWLAKFHQENVSSEDISSDWETSLFFPTAEPILDTVKPTQLQQELGALVQDSGFNLPVCCVHGDFGTHNIIDDGQSFNVIDWEQFQFAAGIVDCVHFTINVLAQARHVPMSSSKMESLLDAFLKPYCEEFGYADTFVSVVKLVAISNVFKRQEWTGRPFRIHERYIFVALIKKIARRNYQQLF